jgi:hypothetical protein
VAHTELISLIKKRTLHIGAARNSDSWLLYEEKEIMLYSIKVLLTYIANFKSL